MSQSARARALVGALCSVLLTPAVSQAEEPVGAQAFCLPGGTGRCFAFAINDAATGFDVWLRNLSPFADDVASPFAIREFGLQRVNTRTADGLRTDISVGFGNANVATTGGARAGGAGLSENTNAADFPTVRNSSYSMFGSYGVLGCALPAAEFLGASGYAAITCAERGLDGWLRISFGETYGTRVYSEPGPGVPVWRAATREDVAVQVAGCTTHVGAQSGVTGATLASAACESSVYGASVAPEPAVVWLVGAGFAGVLGAARLRRRAEG
jgi:hypothetical protein